MAMMRRIGGGAVALGMLAAMLAGCGSDGDGTSAPGGSGDAAVPSEVTPGGRLIMAIDAETDGWTPATNRFTSAGLNVARAVYDPLAAFDVDGVARPYLAESIEPNEGFTTWTITLRDGVSFHNGDALTAEAVVANLEAVKASALIGPTFKDVDTITATGPLTVEVTMARPWATFPVLIAQQPGFIAHPSMFTAENPDPIGTGPFVYDEWVPDSHFLAQRNADYWRTDAAGASLPYLDQVEFRVIADPTSRRQAIDVGDVDVVQTNDAATLTDLGRELEAPDGAKVIYTSGSDDEALIALNSQTGDTQDATLRRALALALDRDLLNDSLYDGHFDLAESPYASDSPWFVDPEWPDYDAGAAEALVNEVVAAGGAPEITLSVLSNPDQLELGQAIASMWTEVGIDTQIEAQDATSLTLQIVTGGYEAALFSLFNSPDPDGDYHFWDTTNIAEPGEFSLAFTRYESETMAAALDAARSTTDTEERAGHYGVVWREIATDLPVIWLWHTQFVLVTRSEVQGIETFTLPDGDPAQIVNWGSAFLAEAWLA